ncbi:MAG TPA: hypothetical protein VF331_22255 [Polyangiales bacterium]
MRRIALVCVLMFVAACAADASKLKHGQGSSGTGGSALTQDGGPSGSAGNGFGNGGAVTTSSSTSADGGQCEAGTFCAAKAPDPNNCGTLTLKGDAKTTEKPGNVLLIFDRSGSMADKWNGMDKWQAAGTAMINALTPLQDKLTIGAVLFPSPAGAAAATDAGTCDLLTLLTNPAACLGLAGGGGCQVNPISAADQVTFKAGAQAIAELQTGGAGGMPKYQALNGSTPTSEGVAQADMALAAATLTGTVAAILITDGEPNCAWNQQQTTTTLMSWLSARNIKTYVVGLPGAPTGGAANTLAGLAAAGSNSTESYIVPTDTAALQAKINSIVSQTVSVGFDSCTVHLKPAASVPEKLHLVVTSNGQQQDVPHTFLGQTSPAWTISKDGTTVEILGDLCSNVKKGNYSAISFVFGCVTLPPAPPPPKVT